MRINFFKFLMVGSLALSSLPLAYAEGDQYATVIINNNLNVTYQIVDYTQSGNGFFSGIPTSIQSNETGVAFTGDFYPSSSPSAASFKLEDPNNTNCIDDRRGQLGHCYQAQFTYSDKGRVPHVQILDNSRPCLRNCSFKYDAHNPNDITVIINTSTK
ncbi:MAG: hypothetical protein JSR33_03015 [Proteobacteria bacterium]|nr:hypothetical protein [Pseudomonadota bacterium]